MLRLCTKMNYSIKSLQHKIQYLEHLWGNESQIHRYVVVCSVGVGEVDYGVGSRTPSGNRKSQKSPEEN
jgi:hypothetical protein